MIKKKSLRITLGLTTVALGLTLGRTEAAPAFNHGVASGDPYAESVVLWTRVTPEKNGPITVAWEISEEADFSSRTDSGSFDTDSNRDYTVKVIPGGLTPDTRYFYRFSVEDGQSVSPTGKTKTLPTGPTEQVRFAVFSCSIITVGDFDAFAKATEIGNYDALIHTGDYIYEYGPEYEDPEYNEPDSVFEPPNELRTLNDYRIRYAQYHREPSLQAVRASGPFIVIWDDHEIVDSAYKDGSAQHDEATDGPWNERRDNGLQAYYEWQPIREPASGNLTEAYRSFNFGDLVSLHMLETRLVGMDKPLAIPGEAQIQETLQDLLTIETRQETIARLVPFGFDPELIPEEIPLNAEAQQNFTNNVIIPALLKELLDTAYTDPDRHILGEEQLTWLQSQMNQSVAPWQVLGHQRLIQENKVPAAAAPLVAGAETFTERQLIEAAIPFFNALGKSQNGAELTDTEKSYFTEQAPLAIESLEDWNGYGVERDTVLSSVPAGKKLVSLVGNTHNSFASPIKKISDGTVAGIEFGAPGVSASGYERYGSAAAFEILIGGFNPKLSFVDLEHKGFIDVTFTRAQVDAKYLMKAGTESEPVWEVQPLISEDGLSISIGNPYDAERSDTDGDGLFDWKEISLATNPAEPDSDSDGLSDGIEFLNHKLGFDPLKSDSYVILSSLYTLDQLKALAVGEPVLEKDPDSGNFTLRVQLEKTVNLQQWQDLPASSGSLRVAEDGSIEFEFSSPDNAALFRVRSGSVKDE